MVEGRDNAEVLYLVKVITVVPMPLRIPSEQQGDSSLLKSWQAALSSETGWLQEAVSPAEAGWLQEAVSPMAEGWLLEAASPAAVDWSQEVVSPTEAGW